MPAFGMRRPVGALATVCAPLLCGAALNAEPDFDRRASPASALEAARAASAPEPAAGAPLGGDEVWITVGGHDIRHPEWASLGLGQPELVTADAALYRVPASALPRLADFMHERFGRCGGFFAYENRQRAESDLFAPRAAAPSGPYTIDQGARVVPLLSRIDEGRIRETIEALESRQTRYFQSDAGVAAARWLRDRWEALAAGAPGASARLVAHANWKQPSVVLTIPGAERPDELVVIGGHLDSIAGRSSEKRAPGADDNASGIAVVTELARLLGESGFRPRRTIELMGYAAEEVGLRGSREIAQRYAKEGRKVVAVLQFDMTNFKGSGDGIYVLTDFVDPALTDFVDRLVDAYLGVPRTAIRCGYGCSDHASWSRGGFPAAAVFESEVEAMNPNIHTERDTLANSGGTARHSVVFAKLAAAFAVEAAKAAP